MIYSNVLLKLDKLRPTNIIRLYIRCSGCTDLNRSMGRRLQPRSPLKCRVSRVEDQTKCPKQTLLSA